MCTNLVLKYIFKKCTSQISTPNVLQQRKMSIEEVKGRKNKAFAAIKQELADREKLKKKMAKMRVKSSKKDPRDMVRGVY